MAVVKLLAKNFPLQINQGTEAVPDWLPIKGINSLTLSPAKNTQDTRDYDSGDWQEHMVVSRGATLSLDGQRFHDPDTGARDPGQEEVETYAWETGADAEAQFRVVSASADGTVLALFTATVEVTPFGGGSDDLATWDVELEVTGPLVAA